MKSSPVRFQPLLYVEAIGFLILLALTWIDESVLIPHHWLPQWFGEGNWHDAALESVMILATGCAVIILSARVIARIVELEKFVRVCAWCRKLHHQGQWIPMEEYFLRSSDQRCTHGVCEECAQQLTNEAAITEIGKRDPQRALA